MTETNIQQVAQDSALILIDMQNDVVKREVDGVYNLPEERRDVVSNCQDLVSWARRMSVPVFFVKVDRRADGADMPAATLKASGKMRLAEGSYGNQVIDELSPEDGDYVVVKRRINAFHGTPLDLYLRALKKTTILIGGVATNWGVESTVRAAWDHDYQVVVIADACAAFSPKEHEHAIGTIFPARSTVTTAAELISQSGG